MALNRIYVSSKAQKSLNLTWEFYFFDRGYQNTGGICLFFKNITRDCVRMSEILGVWLYSQREIVWEGVISWLFGYILKVRFRENEWNSWFLATFSTWDCVRMSEILVIWLHCQRETLWEWVNSLLTGTILKIRFCENEKNHYNLAIISPWGFVRMSEININLLYFPRVILWEWVESRLTKTLTPTFLARMEGVAMILLWPHGEISKNFEAKKKEKKGKKYKKKIKKKEKKQKKKEKRKEKIIIIKTRGKD